MPNVMVALSKVGGALYSMPQSLADAHYYMPCSRQTDRQTELLYPSRTPYSRAMLVHDKNQT